MFPKRGAHAQCVYAYHNWVIQYQFFRSRLHTKSENETVNENVFNSKTNKKTLIMFQWHNTVFQCVILCPRLCASGYMYIIHTCKQEISEAASSWAFTVAARLCIWCIRKYGPRASGGPQRKWTSTFWTEFYFLWCYKSALLVFYCR